MKTTFIELKIIKLLFFIVLCRKLPELQPEEKGSPMKKKKVKYLLFLAYL